MDFSFSSHLFSPVPTRPVKGNFVANNTSKQATARGLTFPVTAQRQPKQAKIPDGVHGSVAEPTLAS
jgi:hypothetical protein